MTKQYNKIQNTNKEVINIFNKMLITEENCERRNVFTVLADREQEKYHVNSCLNENNYKNKFPLITVYSDWIYLDKSDPIINYEVRLLSMCQDHNYQIIEQIISKFDNTMNCKLHGINLNKEVLRYPEVKAKIYISELNISVKGIGVPIETR